MESSLAHGGAMTLTLRAATPNLRDGLALAELCVDIFRRDLLAFYPQCRFEPAGHGLGRGNLRAGPDFQLIEEGDEGADAVGVELFGARYRLTTRDGGRLTPHD